MLATLIIKPNVNTLYLHAIVDIIGGKISTLIDLLETQVLWVENFKRKE